jgi:predicted glutamine amidotransferase
MCRFLMAKSAAAATPAALLEAFAAMAEKSRAPDGDRQADGWGAAWLEDDGGWRHLTSTNPVWEDRAAFAGIPPSPILVLHARSASFPWQKNTLAYNQPYVSGPFAFVFNGLLQGVSLPTPVPGDIGAQKIWSLVSERLAASGPAVALAETADLIERNTRRLQGMNVGISDGRSCYALCRFEGGGNYYQMYRHDSAGLKMLCSEPLGAYDFVPVPQKTVVAI